MNKFLRLHNSLFKGSCFLFMCFLTLSMVIFATSTNAEILYENSFDDKPDWTAPENISDFLNTHADALTVGFTSYRTTNGGGKTLYEISSEGARGDTGKCLAHYMDCSTNWTGGGLDIHLGDTDLLDHPNNAGYEELYIRWYEKWAYPFNWGTGHCQQKLVRIYSNDANYDFDRIKVSGGNISSAKGRSNYLIVDWCGPFSSGGPNYYPSWRISGSTSSDQNYGCKWQDHLNDGQWHCVEVHVKMNEIGKNTIIEDLYIDGALCGTNESADKIELRTSADKKFNCVIWADNFYMQCSDLDQVRYLDDLVISTTYIGPDYVINGDKNILEGKKSP